MTYVMNRHISYVLLKKVHELNGVIWRTCVMMNCLNY